MTVDISGNVVGYDDYYPYGMQMTGRSYTSSADQRYKFTEKELDASDGLYYFGKRYYDPFREQWLQVDPMLEKYPSTSPYDYVLSNPIRLVDPDGSVTYMIDGVEIDQEFGQQLAEQYQQMDWAKNKENNNNQNDNGDNAHQVTTKDIVNREEEYFKSKFAGIGNLISNISQGFNDFSKVAVPYGDAVSQNVAFWGSLSGGAISLSNPELAPLGLGIFEGSNAFCELLP